MAWFSAFSVFAAAGLALAWPSLRWPMSYDDLHLVRAYSSSDIVSSFHGPWDPDGIETPGLRPLTLLFKHARYPLLRENVVAHRLFQLALFAAFLTLLARLATLLGLPWSWAVLAGLVSLAARHSVYHYVWLTNGTHGVRGVAAALRRFAALGIDSEVAFLGRWPELTRDALESGRGDPGNGIFVPRLLEDDMFRLRLPRETVAIGDAP